VYGAITQDTLLAQIANTNYQKDIIPIGNLEFIQMTKINSQI
jgi:hypothetical protein